MNNLKLYKGVDGLSQWTALGLNTTSPRTHMIYNIDDEVVPARLDLPSKNTTFQVIKIVQRMCVKFVPRFV